MTDKELVTTSKPIWDGPFQTWDEACSAARNHDLTVPAFTNVRWLQRITQQLVDYRIEFRQFEIAQPPRPCNLPLVCAMTSPSSIIDFGGSSGWCWDYLQNSLPTHAISSYAIVELESVVKHMQGSGLHGDIVRYHTLDDSLSQCDLLYSNSVLQYFESNAPLLSLIERTTPNYIFLEDIIAKGESDFFGTQTNYESDIPYRFIGLKNLLADLSSMGYRNMVKVPYASPILGVMKPFPMTNFPEKFQLRYSLSILLRRMQDR
jgi:putative methyltransferase (TIGR04325 family)